MLREEVKQIKMQASKGEKVDYEWYVDLHPISEKETCLKSMKLWIKKARMFRARAKDDVRQDIRKFGTLM